MQPSEEQDRRAEAERKLPTVVDDELRSLLRDGSAGSLRKARDRLAKLRNVLENDYHPSFHPDLEARIHRSVSESLKDEESTIRAIATRTMQGSSHPDLWRGAIALLADPNTQHLGAAACVSALVGRREPEARSAVVSSLGYQMSDALVTAAFGSTSQDSVRYMRRLAESCVRLEAVKALKTESSVESALELVKVLEDGDQHDEVRRAAADALVGKDFPRVIESLKSNIGSPDPLLRRGSLLALSRTSDSSALSEILRVFESSNLEMKLDCLVALSGRPETSVQRSLVAAMTGQNRELDRLCAEGLSGKLAPPEMPPLVRILTRESWPHWFGRVFRGAPAPDEHLLAACAVAMKGRTEPEVIGALAHRMTDKRPLVRRHAAEALAGQSSPRAIRALIAGLADADENVKIASILSLTGTTDPEAESELTAMLDHPEQSLRVAAANALKGTRSPPAVGRLARGTALLDPMFGKACAAALRGNTHPSAIDGLVNGLSSHNSITRQECIEALREIDDPIVTQKLIKGSSSPYSPYREAFVEALGEGKDKRRIECLTRCLLDPTFPASSICASKLKGIDEPEVISALMKGIETSTKSARPRAALAIECGRALAGMLSDEQAAIMRANLSAADPVARQACALALGARDDDETTRALVCLFRDPSSGVRRAACEALSGSKRKAAVEALLDAASDPKPVVREAALTALARLTF